MIILVLLLFSGSACDEQLNEYVISPFEIKNPVWKLICCQDYVCVGIGIFILFVIVYWLLYGKTFEGPVSTPQS
jgi:hypothetical protein